jgi:hypothetical protein
MLGRYSGAASQPCCYSPSSFQVLILDLKNLMAGLLIRSIYFYVVQILPVSKNIDLNPVSKVPVLVLKLNFRQAPSFLCSSYMNKI